MYFVQNRQDIRGATQNTQSSHINIAISTTLA